MARLVRVFKVFWRGASALSTLQTIFGLLPAGAAAVITGWAARAEHFAPVVVAVLMVVVAAVVYVTYVAFLLHRRQGGIGIHDEISAEVRRPEARSVVSSALLGQDSIGSALSQAVRSGAVAGEEPETPIWVALQTIAGRIGDRNADDGFPEARRKLRQAARNGQVVPWGREQIPPQHHGDNRHRDLSVPIPASYWNDFRINREAAAEVGENDAHTENEDLPLRREGRFWRIKVHLKEINRQWPKEQSSSPKRKAATRRGR